jgi:hypothetical protein
VIMYASVDALINVEGVELLLQFLYHHRRGTSKNKKGALCPTVLNARQNITPA